MALDMIKKLKGLFLRKKFQSSETKEILELRRTVEVLEQQITALWNTNKSLLTQLEEAEEQVRSSGHESSIENAQLG